jgi:hypothetical protein
MECLVLAIVSLAFMYLVYRIGEAKGEVKGWDEATQLYRQTEEG